MFIMLVMCLLYTYMLIPFEGIIYFLDVNKCIHLVSGGTHSTFLERFCYGALLSRLLEISAIKYLTIIANT